VIREAKGGYHTVAVQRGIVIGFLLFLVSEIMLFFSFIWAYLHSSLAPSIELGAVWPPVGIESLNPWALPLVATLLLLASGMTLTLSHHALIAGQKRMTLVSLFLTIV
jgi:cytochrome c oxidase subunit 3